MNRRRYLAGLAGFGFASLLAGCTEQSLEAAESKPPWAAEFDEARIDLPVAQVVDLTADGIRRADGETFEDISAFESFVEENGFAVEHLEAVEVEGETVLELEFVAETPIENGAAPALGVASGGYAALVPDGFDGAELIATFLEPSGAAYGEFEILTEWAEEYADGKSSASVYANYVLHTLKSR